MKAPCLSKTRACVASLRAALLQPAPEALEAYLPALAEAIETFSELAEFGAESASIQGDIRGLKTLALDLAACDKLIQYGVATTKILAGILAGANSGYSSNGRPPALAARNKVSLQG